MQTANLPSVFLFDREYAALNAFEAVFPGIAFQLCCWHIDMAIEENCRRVFFEVGDGNMSGLSDWNSNYTQFYSAWIEVRQSSELEYRYL